MRRAPGLRTAWSRRPGLLGRGPSGSSLIGSETLTRITNWSDRTNAFLFGDGAGAVVVEAVPGEPALLGWDIGVDGSLQPLFFSDYGGPGMAMRGQEVFRKAVRVTVDSATKSLERAKLTPSDVALFVPHQANMRIMDAVAERLGFRRTGLLRLSSGRATLPQRPSRSPSPTRPTMGASPRATSSCSLASAPA